MKEPFDDTLKNLAGTSQRFQAPEGYFERFPERMAERVSDSKRQQPAFLKFAFPAIAAAMIAIVALLLYPSTSQESPSEEIDPLAYYAIEEEDFAFVMDTDSLPRLVAENLQPAAIEQYLLEHETDLLYLSGYE